MGYGLSPASQAGHANNLHAAPRVAHTLSLMYAPHEHAQHPCRRVLSVGCPAFLTVADIKGDVGATRDNLIGELGVIECP
jgi:hypothetical protein